MQPSNLIATFVRRLNSSQLPYMVTGSVAGTIYGEPRLTHDVDFVVLLGCDADATKLHGVFPENEFYCPPEEVINVERRRSSRGHFNIIEQESGLKADIYPVSQDPLHHWGMQHKRNLLIENEGVWVAPPEYVIIRKLEYFREGHSEKHVRDIAAMLRTSESLIDLKFIEAQVAERNLTPEWTEAKSHF